MGPEFVAFQFSSQSFDSDAGMGPPLDSVPSLDRPPASADVVIVGGGIIGVATALFLARDGVSVVLCEKGQVAAEQSSRNWGWCRRMGRDDRELPLIIESLRLWDRMEELAGEDVGFRRTGITYLCSAEGDVAHHEDWLLRAGPYGLDSRLLRGKDLDAVVPGASRRFVAGLNTPSDGRAEPQRAVPAMARAAIRSRAAILTNCAVRAVETTAGRVSGVVTEKGRIAASTVLVAGGVWSSLLLRTLGIRLPQLGVRSSVMRTGPLPGGPEGAASAGHFAYRKRLDGGYTIAGGGHQHDIVPSSFSYFRDFLPVMMMDWRDLGIGFGTPFFEAWRLSGPWSSDAESPFEKMRILDPQPIHRHTERARLGLAKAFPFFAGAPIIQRWAGVIDATPDAVPVISPVASLPGLVIATGFSGHGFGIGPGAGRLAADLVTGGTPLVDPAPYRYERFIDGSRPRPQSGL